MRILIVGNGGREHALLWKIRRDEPAAELFATRPNAGMAALCTGVDLSPTDVDGLLEWAGEHGMDLTIVGPEAPLAAGIVDRFQEAGLAIFGPTAAAARIEASKAWAKGLMSRWGIPTAAYETFTEAEAAEGYIRHAGAPVVVKASGLAAGKGAIVCATVEEAVEAARGMLAGDDFGGAGDTVVVEEFMEGEELSIFAVCDGTVAVYLLPSQDHKAVGEGDTGPNTGGMGAYAPVSLVTRALLDEARRRIFEPTLAALADEGAPFTGLLYGGLMKTDEGLKVVEFNCRFGDPETQVILPLLKSSLVELLRTVADGRSVEELTPVFREGAAVTTVIASGGYPGSYEKGKAITIPDGLEDDDLTVFHAGTRRTSEGGLETAGGRVLAVTAVGASVSEAAERSRAGAAAIDFHGAFFRRDIGWRERARTQEST